MKRAKDWSQLSQKLQRFAKRHQKRWDDYHGPISTDGQWFSSEGCILSNEEKYRLGDDSAIMHELTWCLTKKKPIPEWLRIALLRAIKRAVLCEIDSWDEVLGPPVVTETLHPARGKTRLAMKRKQNLIFPICERIEQLTAEGKPVDRRLFEQVAAEFGIGRAHVERLFYDYRAFVTVTREGFEK